MTKISIAALAALLVAGMSPAFAAKTDCDAGYKTFLGKMMAAEFPPADLAEAVRRSLKAYDSCKAGDDFSPQGVWDEILAKKK